MRLLLDTHLLLWAVRTSPTLQPAGRLSARARTLILDEENALFFSAASIWEVAIKYALGRAEFEVEPHRLRAALLANGYLEIAITGLHGAAVRGLAGVHKDPFDRLLIAQATVEDMTLLTSDAVIAAYPGPILRV